MPDLRPTSLLDAAISTADADLVAVSQDIGGGARRSRKATLTQLREPLLHKTGGTVTGAISSTVEPSVVTHLATKGYVDTQAALRLSLALGGTVSGPISIVAAPTGSHHLTNKTYVDAQAALRLALTGGTVSGPITIADAPTLSEHLANKAYVDGLAGPIVLANVGGTLNPDGTCTTYTADAPTGLTPVENRVYRFTPHADSAALPAISINGATARSLRRGDSTAVLGTIGMLKAGRLYDLTVTMVGASTVIQASQAILADSWFGDRGYVGTTLFRITWMQPGDAFQRSAITFSTSGFDVNYGGDGTVASPIALRISPDLSTRLYGPAVTIDGTALIKGATTIQSTLAVTGDLTLSGSLLGVPASFSTSNLPPPNDEMIELLEEIPAAVYETRTAAILIATTHPFILSPTDQGRHLWCNTPSVPTLVDCSQMALHSDHEVYVPAARTAILNTGSSNWNTRTSNLVGLAPGRYKIWRDQTGWEIFVYRGTATDDTATIWPTYARVIATMGYSNMKRTGSAVAGMRDWRLGLGLNPAVKVLDCCFGASALWKGAPAAVDNYYWDRDAGPSGGPGPNLTSLAPRVGVSYSGLAEIIEASGETPELLVIHYGYPDMTLLGSTLTEANYAQDTVNMVAWIRTRLGLPSLKVMICPMANRHVGVWATRLWYALRRAQLKACEIDPLILRGPESYDLRFIWEDSHPTYRSQRIFNQRIGLFHETIMGRRADFLGPRIINFIEDSSTQYRFVIAPGPENLDYPGVGGDLTNAPLPPGIAVIGPGGDYTSLEALPIKKCAWSVSGGDHVLTVTLASPQSGGRGCFPWGEMFQTGQSPRLSIRSLTTKQPLGTFLSGV